MPLRFIFKTEKETGDTKFAGQTNQDQVPHGVGKLTTKVTGEKTTHVTGNPGDVLSGHTANYHVDLIPKSVFQGENQSAFKSIVGAYVPPADDSAGV